MATQAKCVVLAAGLVAVLAACGPAPDDPAHSGSSAAAGAGAGSSVASDDLDASAPARVALAALPAASGGESDLGELRSEVQELRREVRDVRLQLAHGPGAVVAAASAPDPRTDPTARQQAQQAERQRVAAAETSFQSEQRDPRWSQGEAAAIQSALGQVEGGLQSEVRSIDCRTQTCRVEINAGDPQQMQQALPMVLAQLGQTLPRVTAGQEDEGDGRQATVLYLSR